MDWINPLLDFNAPGNSLLLTKGAHSGPAWDPTDSETVREWIALEAIARGIVDVPPPTTALFVPVFGPNTVPLDPLGMPGSSVTFLYEPLDTGAYLSEIKLNGGTGGEWRCGPVACQQSQSDQPANKIHVDEQRR